MPRLLIVDDEHGLLTMAKRALEARGHEVLTAQTAEEGLALARAGGVSAVFLDLELPDRSGLTAIREMAEASRAPVFVMTGHADPEIERDALLLGAAGFLAKPFDFGAACALLAERLK